MVVGNALKGLDAAFPNWEWGFQRLEVRVRAEETGKMRRSVASLTPFVTSV